MIPELDLLSSAARGDLHATLARVRAASPVVVLRLGWRRRALCLTRHAAVAELLSDARFTEASAVGPAPIEMLPRSMERIAETLLNDAERRRTMDLIGDFADPLVFHVVAEASGHLAWSAPLMRFRLRGLRGPHTEAAVHLIGNGMLALIEHPAELERLRAHPELLDGALEELLRFTSPQLLSTPRTAMEDVVLEGVPLPRGSVVRGLLASANRDRGAFRDADDLDLARRAGRPVVGAHVSPSLAFARRVAKVGLRALLRYPDIRLVGHPSLVKWRRSAELRGLRSLPLYLGGRARKEAQRAA